MRAGHLSITMLVAGILGIALAGCGNSGGGGSTGGTTSGQGSSAPPTGGGGATSIPADTGGSPSGGTTSNTGTTGQVAGGTTGRGGTTASGGSVATGGGQTGGAVTTGGNGTGGRGSGGRATGGATEPGTGGTTTSPGTTSTGGASTGGLTGATGGRTAGGAIGTGGRGSGGASGGGATGVAGTSGTGGRTAGGSTGSSGTCVASKAANVNTSGSGTHKVTVESNSEISCGTIYRPSDLGGTEKYPIFVWGEGACSRSGTSNSASMGEIASHGYFVIADGPPSGGNCASISMPSSASDLPNMAKPLLDYVTWAIAENGKSCSAYYDSIDTTKVAADGFSCGGLMAEGTASDSRMTAWGVTSSGLTSPDQNFYKKVHTPVKILLGGTKDVAYTNGTRDYDNISALGIPIILFSKNIGHGGDLTSSRGGDFTKINLAWLNWQLKGDETATGKGFLVGDTCTFCKDSAWETRSKNLP